MLNLHPSGFLVLCSQFLLDLHGINADVARRQQRLRKPAPAVLYVRPEVLILARHCSWRFFCGSRRECYIYIYIIILPRPITNARQVKFVLSLQRTPERCFLFLATDALDPAPSPCPNSRRVQQPAGGAWAIAHRQALLCLVKLCAVSPNRTG